MATKKIFVSMRIDDKSRDENLQLQKNIATAVAENINEKFKTQDDFTLIDVDLAKKGGE